MTYTVHELLDRHLFYCSMIRYFNNVLEQMLVDDSLIGEYNIEDLMVAYYNLTIETSYLSSIIETKISQSQYQKLADLTILTKILDKYDKGQYFNSLKTNISNEVSTLLRILTNETLEYDNKYQLGFEDNVGIVLKKLLINCRKVVKLSDYK